MRFAGKCPLTTWVGNPFGRTTKSIDSIMHLWMLEENPLHGNLYAREMMMPHNKKQMDRGYLVRAKKSRYSLDELITLCDQNAKIPADMEAWIELEYIESEWPKEELKMMDEPCKLIEKFECNKD